MSGTTKWMAAGPLKDYLEKVSAENKEKSKYCSICEKPTASKWACEKGSPFLFRACEDCYPEEN